MRNRNTLGDQWKPNTQRNLTNSVDRKTVINPQNSMPQIQQRQATQQHNNEKMCQKINKVLAKTPDYGKRTSFTTVIHPKASTLFTNIAQLMNSIDNDFQKSYVDIDSIPQLLLFWCYPYNYNKSVFQPIGAPHTWPSCLQMMEFLAEITNYFFEYKQILAEYKLDPQQIDLMLQAFSKDSCANLQSYFENEIAALKKQESELIFKIQSSELTIKNIKNSQRSLTEVEMQQSVLLQKLQRESQNVIQIDQKNNIIINEIQKNDDLLEEIQITKNSLQNKVKLLEDEITNQQLSLEQASKMQCQIKQYQSRIKDAQNEHESKKKQYQFLKNKIVENFYKVVDDLNEIKNSIKKYANQMQKRNIDIAIPNCDHVAFTEAIHTQDINNFRQSINRSIEIDKIKQMLITQESLADILEHESKILNSRLAETQLKKNQGDIQSRQLTTQVQRLQKLNEEGNNQVLELQRKYNRTLDRIQQLKQSTNSIKCENQRLLSRQIELTEQTKKRKQQMLNGIKLFKIYETDCQNTLKNIQAKYAESKKKIQQILQRVSGGFNYLNGELEKLL